jgi:hypothetical protein
MYRLERPAQRNSKKEEKSQDIFCWTSQKDMQKLCGGGYRLTECVTRDTTCSQNNDAVSERDKVAEIYARWKGMKLSECQK